MQAEDHIEAVSLPINCERICCTLAAGIGALFALSLGQDLLFWAGAPIDRTYMVDVDVEGGAFAWASSLLLALNALVLFGLWRAADRDRAAWMMLGAGFLFLSMDEMVGVHERINGILSQALATHGLLYFIWVLPALFVTIVLFVLFLPFLSRLPRVTAKLFLFAGALYIGGALGAEMAGGAFAETLGHMSPPYRLLAHVEEGMEVGGQFVFLAALLGYARAQRTVWGPALLTPQNGAPTALHKKPITGEASA